MKLNKALNLVIPVETDNGIIYVHSTPISRAIFEQYFLVISKTFSGIFSHGLGALAGPRIAYLMLKQTAQELGMWEGQQGVEKGLINEIIRLSNIVITGENGWETIPLDTAIKHGKIDSDTLSEVEGELVFFTCISCMNKANQALMILETVSDQLEFQCA